MEETANPRPWWKRRVKRRYRGPRAIADVTGIWLCIWVDDITLKLLGVLILLLSTGYDIYDLRRAKHF